MFIGPIASFICDEYMKDHGEPHNPSELKQMMEVISREIGDEEKEEMFKKMELS
jgi:FKBP-type peptidyl-prolyl cis-trans isomerase (trigger factor)